MFNVDYKTLNRIHFKKSINHQFFSRYIGASNDHHTFEAILDVIVEVIAVQKGCEIKVGVEE